MGCKSWNFFPLHGIQENTGSFLVQGGYHFLCKENQEDSSLNFSFSFPVVSR